MKVIHKHTVNSLTNISLVASQANNTLLGLTDFEIQSNKEKIKNKLKIVMTAVDGVSDILIFDKNKNALVAANSNNILDKLDISDFDPRNINRDDIHEVNNALCQRVFKRQSK